MNPIKNLINITNKINPFLRKVFKSIYFWSLLFIILIIFLFYKSQDEKYYNLKVGDLAPKDIVLKKAISFENFQESEKKRYEAAQNVLPVFDFQKNKSTILIKQLEEIFKSKSENSLIPEETFKVFLKHNFSSELMDTLSGIILQIYQNPVVTSKKYLAAFYQKGYIRRIIETNQEEISVDVFSVLDYPKDVEIITKSELKKVKFLSSKDKEILTEFLTEYCTPNLTLNALETNHRREKKMQEVLPISYNLPKGYTVARKGDVLNEIQIAILNQIKEKKNSLYNLNFYLGIFLLSILSLIFLYKIIFSQKIIFYGYNKNSTFNLIIFLYLSLIYMVYLIKYLFEALAGSFLSKPFNDINFWYLTIPFSLGAFLLRLFSTSIISVAFGIIFSLFASLLFGHFSFFFTYALTGTFIAILSYKYIKFRWDVTKIGIFVGLGNIFSVFCFSFLFENPLYFSSSSIIEQAKTGLFILFLSFLGGIFSSALVNFLSPIIESTFGIFSNLRLLELASQNHPILKELALKAPGTYQHSINLSILVERAAEEINANPLLAKVAALFHDIGKIFKPEFFIENQKGKNPHENLEPSISRIILANHLTKGIEIAKKFKLPRAIIDSITMHHGKKVMHYFYHKAMNKEGNTSEEEYRYQGVLPDTKEMSILLLADSVEAASRSLEEPDIEKITNLVEKIVNDSIEDGQLKESELSFKEVEIIKKCFIQTLSAMYHIRIEYPNFDFNIREENGNNHIKQNKKKDKGK